MLRKCCNAAAGRHPQACVGSQQHRQQAQLPQSPPCSLQQLGPGFHSPECAKVTGSANDSSHPSPGWGAAVEQPPPSAQHQQVRAETARRRLSRERKDKQESGWVQKRGGAGEEEMPTCSLCHCADQRIWLGALNLPST